MNCVQYLQCEMFCQGVGAEIRLNVREPTLQTSPATKSIECFAWITSYKNSIIFVFAHFISSSAGGAW